MLECMIIDNVALIDHAEISFSNGFQVFTGETGAGKSILVGSINMLLGERVSREIIRYGEKRAMVQGVFHILEPRVLSVLAENGWETDEDGTLIVSRELSADGKNICRVGGCLVPVNKLRELGRWLVNIHGQHDNQALLDRTSHIDFLDSFSDELHPIFELYRTKYYEYVNTEKELAALQMDEAEKLRRLDILNYEIQELEDADLRVGEEEELKQQCKIANNAKNLLSQTGQAINLLYENEEGSCAYNLLASAAQLVESASEIDPAFFEASENLTNALASVQETVHMLQDYFDRADMDETSLEQMEDRLDVIYRLKRKYGGSEENALAHLQESREERSRIEFMDENRGKLEQKVKKLREETESLAQTVSGARKSAAQKLSAQICENLAFLNMPNAVFFVQITPCDINEKGMDSVEFLLSANKGEPPKPLTKIVSGGELSRIMLAIKSILSETDAVATLIFDEVDSGVSGRAAQRLGDKLKELSHRKQVLCVTHLAQVASAADKHFLIEKKETDGKTKTFVTALEREGRIEELARIIGGEHVTETTYKQAEEMLDD